LTFPSPCVKGEVAQETGRLLVVQDLNHLGNGQNGAGLPTATFGRACAPREPWDEQTST
jgi:hypothetical protein